ncbi:MAG: UDP-N-acetylmuramate dehydrogenase [Candidatus Lloydbacteria bacterium]|nr:UDP-N-acetylmuramate dehydrogenase [Candidatus Lloydbacteria bacterium]
MDIKENEAMALHTTFRIGGPARYFCEVSNEAELKEALLFAEKQAVPFFVLGGGSNILVSDKGFPGLVIKMRLRGKEYADDGSFALVIAQAGESWDSFVEDTVTRGLCGIENLSAIPGTVGASPVQNIGAYGQEVKDTIEWVEVFDPSTKEIRQLSNAECAFAYRQSIFKKRENKQLIVLRVAFRLSNDARPHTRYPGVSEHLLKKGITNPNAMHMREAIMSIRMSKLPDIRETGTAGSFFKNPLLPKEHSHIFKNLFPEAPLYPHTETHDKVSAAWLIKKIGGEKRFRRGDAAVYVRQPLVLVNHRNATAKDMFSLACDIQSHIKKEIGIELSFEVETVGEFL